MIDIVMTIITDIINCLPLVFVMVFIFGLVGLMCRGGRM